MECFLKAIPLNQQSGAYQLEFWIKNVRQKGLEYMKLFFPIIYILL